MGMREQSAGSESGPDRPRPASGPYWTPAGAGAGWVNLVLEGMDESSVGPAVSLQLAGASGEGLLAPDQVVPSPTWSGVSVVHFRVADPESWLRYRLVGDGWDAPAHPTPGAHRKPTGLRFLILSDLQLLPLVGETLSGASYLHRERAFDAVLYPGDMVEAPERKEDWWGDSSGRSFFDLLAPPDGSGILSTTLLVPCPGNHDISASRGSTPHDKLNNVQPDDWNLRIYGKLFALPQLPEDVQKLRRRKIGPGVGPADYYSVRLGDVWIGSLFVTRAYVKGDHEKRRGAAYEWPGRFIFEPITKGSIQYEWLRRALDSPECRGARVRIIVLHHGIFSQGHNAILPFGIPPEYEEDFLTRDLVPLLSEGGVHIVFNGHNHVVNHHVVDGIHYVESSHIGSTYGPYARMPDGSFAPEPHGHPSRLFITEPGNGYVSSFDTAGTGRLVTYQVEGGRPRIIDEVELGFEA